MVRHGWQLFLQRQRRGNMSGHEPSRERVTLSLLWEGEKEGSNQRERDKKLQMNSSLSLADVCVRVCACELSFLLCNTNTRTHTQRNRDTVVCQAERSRTKEASSAVPLTSHRSELTLDCVCMCVCHYSLQPWKHTQEKEISVLTLTVFWPDVRKEEVHQDRYHCRHTCSSMMQRSKVMTRVYI